MSAIDDAESERVWNTSTGLEYTVTHVFLPFTPEAQSHEPEDDHLLVCAVSAVARAYSEIIDDALKPQWGCIAKMLANLEASIRHGLSLDSDIEGHVTSLLDGMQIGGTLSISLQTLC